MRLMVLATFTLHSRDMADLGNLVRIIALRPGVQAVAWGVMLIVLFVNQEVWRTYPLQKESTSTRTDQPNDGSRS
jgi:hypothetical protein